MGTTTTYGYKKPTSGDTDWWDQLEDNIDQMDDHAHDGVSGIKIEAKNVTKSTNTIANTDWSADAGGSTYSYTLTMPTGHIFDNAVMSFIDTDNNIQIFPTVVKASASTMTITVNDNTLNVRVIYA
jgi:hypothetical protein